MSRSRSDLARAAVAAGAFALVATACGSAGDPGVRTESALADVVFGVEAVEEAELASLTPPAPVSTGTQTPVVVGRDLNLPFRNQIPSRFQNIAITVPNSEVSAGGCPDASLGTPPRELAGRNAATPPQPGLYRYKVTGTQTVTVNGIEATTPVMGFEPRVVRAVEQTSETSWTFEVVEPFGDTGSRTTTWSVNTDPAEIGDPTSSDTDGDGLPDGRGIKPPYVGENPIRAGEPGRGIAIESIVDKDENGNVIGSFDAIPVLLSMPLPVLPGESFQSFAIDIQGQAIANEAEVLKQQTTDACGELVDGWLVSMATTTVQSLDSATVNQEYIFSTPMGGLPVSHRIAGQSIDPVSGATVAFDVTYSIGQLDPTPLPDDGSAS